MGASSIERYKAIAIIGSVLLTFGVWGRNAGNFSLFSSTYSNNKIAVQLSPVTDVGAFAASKIKFSKVTLFDEHTVNVHKI